MASLQRLATNMQRGVIADCGHWMPEEQPEELLRRLLPFLAEG